MIQISNAVFHFVQTAGFSINKLTSNVCMSHKLGRGARYTKLTTATIFSQLSTLIGV